LSDVEAHPANRHAIAAMIHIRISNNPKRRRSIVHQRRRDGAAERAQEGPPVLSATAKLLLVCDNATPAWRSGIRRTSGETRQARAKWWSRALRESNPCFRHGRAVRRRFMRPECRELMRYWLKAAHTNAIARFLGLAQPLTTREVEVLDRPTT